MAHTVAEAIETATPIRRCTKRPGRVPRAGACVPAQLGVSMCPCAGLVTREEYAAVVDQVVRGLTVAPHELLDPLAARMRALADAARYEEAAAVRDRAAALANAIFRQRRLDALRNAGRITLEVDGGGGATLEHGRLVAAWSSQSAAQGALSMTDDLPTEGPLPRHLADELSTVASWLDQRVAKVRLLECDGPLAWPLPRIPSFAPAKSSARPQPLGA